MKNCQCGCGLITQKTFIHGHNRKNIILFVDTRKRMSLAKQKEKHPMFGRHHTEESILKIRQKRKLQICQKHTKETKKKIGISNKKYWINPEWKEVMVEKYLKAMLKRPTSLENKFFDIIIKNNLPYKYVGNGAFLIGYKNPDFINTNNEKICIEVANYYHHQNDWAKKRKEHFEKWGWKCLIFFEDEIIEEKILEVLNDRTTF